MREACEMGEVCVVPSPIERRRRLEKESSQYSSTCIVSHSLKKLAKRFHIDVLFSSSRKISRICAAVERKDMSCSGTGLRSMKHTSTWPAAWQWSETVEMPTRVYRSNRTLSEYSSARA